MSYVAQTTRGEVRKCHVDQIGEVAVLSEEVLIPTVEQPTEEPLSEMECTTEYRKQYSQGLNGPL